MAAGRGEFFSSVVEGFQRLSAQLAPPAPGTRAPALGSSGEPGPGRRQDAEPEKRRVVGRGRWKTWRRGRKWPQAEAKVESSNIKERTHTKRGADLVKVEDSSSKANFLERLPTEILIKILSYLNAPSLFCVSHVSKLFHRLANDDVVWQKIYVSEFGSQTWKPKTKGVAVETEDQSLGHWKRTYFRTVAGQEMDKWRKDLKDKSPYTGLPRQTEWVLRNLNVSWVLTVYDVAGSESLLHTSRAHFFESSVVVCWSKCNVSKHHIASIQLHGVRKGAPKSLKIRTDWSSLILKVDRDSCHRVIGKDKLMKLIHASPGVIIGVWRGQRNVAFIMVSLHFHKLVEKSLLGSPACPYSEPDAARPLSHGWDPGLGRHGYTLHFVLHNTGTEIMSGHFRQLSSRTGQVQHGLLELVVIKRANMSQHRSLSGNVNLQWKSDSLEGSVENCCIMTMTLLDEFQKPFWCVSSPTSIHLAEKPRRSDYGGEHFLMDYQDGDGKVKMELVWLKEEKQFFLIGLTLYVSVFKINKHFSQNY